MSRLRGAHQVFVDMPSDDARDCALELQLLLWSCDVRSEVFTPDAPTELASLVRDPRDMADLPSDALLLVHHTAADQELEPIAKLPHRKVLIRHASAPADGVEALGASLEIAASEGEDPQQIVDRLREGLAGIGVELPQPRALNVVVVSSEERCGIHDYSVAVCEGLRRRGHRVTFIGVRRADTADLFRKLGFIRGDVDAVLIEHEAGVFRDVTLARALFSLRRRGFKVVLSFHELEPEKFHHYRRLMEVIREAPRGRSLLEALRVVWRAVRMCDWFVRYRLVLALMGALPDRLVVHSRRSARWLPLLTSDKDKVDEFPLPIIALEGTDRPTNRAEKRALRERLGLPLEAFIFVSPGFFFPRKRYVEVMRALPSGAVLVLSGTATEDKAAYHAEVMAEARARPNVIVDQEYDAMGDHVVAADCVVLFYDDVFQSAVVTQAVWAGLPAIVSDADGFGPYAAAAIVVRDTAELARAMVEVQRPETYARLMRGVVSLRRLLAPERLADRYLAGLGR